MPQRTMPQGTMPSYHDAGHRDPELEHDHEHWPVGHYRGRGNRQDHTGPNGPYLEGAGSEHLRPPSPPPRRQPKNYVRSDRRIFEEVCELLTDHGDIDASDIEVIVDDRDVILRGTVRSRWAFFYVEDLILDVTGVRDIVNELRIARAPDGRMLEGPTTDGGGPSGPRWPRP